MFENNNAGPLDLSVLDRNLNRGFRMWHFNEIYVGMEAPGRVVPNVNDAVLDWTTGVHRVVSVDPNTHLSVLEKTDLSGVRGVPELGVLLGIGETLPSELCRLYVDDSVTPNTIALSSQLHLYGSHVDHIIIYRGTDISENGEIISATFDADGISGDKMPLEKVGEQTVDNIAIMAPVEAHTTSKLVDGEMVSIVVKSVTGAATDVIRMVVKKTQFIKRVNTVSLYVTGISIKSPYLSDDIPNTIAFPHNLPVDNLYLKGLVHYSNGETREVDIDGIQMSMLGLNNFIPSISGQRIPCILHYKLRDNESSYHEDLINGTLSKKYTLMTKDVDLNYNMKLFVSPKWIDAVSGYRLSFYLYNADRDIKTDVTGHVSLDPEAGSLFNPTLYGTEQELVLVLKLSDVDPAYKVYTHYQRVTVTLVGPADSTEFPWRIDYSNVRDNVFGGDTHALMEMISEVPKQHHLTICAGEGNFEDWLEKVYYATRPMVIRDVEARAPEPTHMLIQVGNDLFERPIGTWNIPLVVSGDHDIGCVINVYWINKDTNRDLQLGMSTFNPKFM